MGKRRQKPLLADTGILHLNSCFVQPSEESGLLTTVGGQDQPLVLASGSYGYGIPHSVAQKAAENALSKAEEEVDPDVLMVREINGGVYSVSELSKDRSGIEKEVNDEEMTVAELVRSIGGARDAPIRKCDVVEDRTEKEQQKAADDKEERDKAASGELPEPPDSQADEFYASLGIPNPNEKQKDDDDGDENDKDKKDDGKEHGEQQNNGESQQQHQPHQPPSNFTDGIRDFYKTYTQYYYSKEPNPFDDQRLEFGLPISAVDDNSNDGTGQGIGGEQTIIQLARMAQIRARQAAAAAAALDKAKKAKAISTVPVGPGEVVENEAEIYDPLPMEVVPSTVAEDLGITGDTTLEQYWEFVKDDPHDFNRWIYLIHYAESKNNIATCRKVYSAFLPLFSYCFGYWKRYSEMEKRFNYYGRALTILERGLEFIPLSVDLWLSYIKLFGEVNAHDLDFKDLIRGQYERALNTCGMEFRSDALWDDFIRFETDNKKLKRVFSLYGRILQVPTRLFNRHWDNFQALVRDHHPRDFLEKDEYEYVRKKGCKKLGFKYKEEPEYEAGEIKKPTKPEDSLMDYVKEKILKKMTKVHVKCEEEAEKRWVFEDRIRRPYFHTKPLDKYQLRNWEEYLNFEITEADHDRIVLLFERCVISCALYESFWCKYARYLERYHKTNSNTTAALSIHFLRNQDNLEIGSKQETEEEEKRIEDVRCTIDDIICQLEQKENIEKAEISSTVKHLVNAVTFEELKEKHNVFKLLTPIITQVIGVSVNDLSKISDRFFELAQCYGDKVSSVGYIAATEELRTELVSPKLIGDDGTLVSKPPVKSGEQELDFNDNSSPAFTTLLSVPDFPPAKFTWQEAVRDVYKRACIVHCPKKPAIRLQWAAFEEELGNSQQALELLKHVEVWFPNHLEAKIFILEIERRRGNHAEVCRLYDKYINAATKNKYEFSMFSMKYGRFLHKELRKPDKALRILRNAIKKDKANPRLYSYVFEICYEKYPDDKRAAVAALELAIACKEFPDEQRLIFMKKKLLYLQEHGDIRKYRDTLQQMIELQEIVRQRETEEMRRKEEEQRLKIGTINPHLSRFPVPEWTAVTENLHNQKAIPIEFEPVVDTIVDNNNHPPSLEEMQQDEILKKFKKVAPPEELNLSNYGYASKHPDYKLAEYMAHKEYEKLENQGYPEDIKDQEGDTKSRKRKAEDDGPIYIVQPKSATLYCSTSAPSASANPSVPGAKGPEIIELEAPQRLSKITVPSTSPCINVPDWFIKEGGELCLSETRAGFSVLRYWPHFLNDVGQQKMFKSVRRSVKWHQKQRVVWGQWRYVQRLLSWLGPCEWSDRGLELKKNEDWPPEILDLLHRINQITQHEFNSCFLNLYRTGHDSHPWHGDIHPAYGANPPVATISLGSLRLFEMKRRGLVHNFIRFPLFPGSLLIMEGACQIDWSHQIPKDPKVEGERISLVFRVMHAIEPVDKAKQAERERLLDNDEGPEEMDIEVVITGSNRNGEVTNKSDRNSTSDKKTSSDSPKKDKLASSKSSSSSKSVKINGKLDTDSEIEKDRKRAHSPDVVILNSEPVSKTKIIFHNRK